MPDLNQVIVRSIAGLANQGGSGAQFVGAELYEKLRTYLKTHCGNLAIVSILQVEWGVSLNCSQRLEQTSRQNLLSVYVDEWEWYSVAAKFVSFVFHYLDQHWVPKQMASKTPGVYEVYNVWKGNFSFPIHIMIHEISLCWLFGAIPSSAASRKRCDHFNDASNIS